MDKDKILSMKNHNYHEKINDTCREIIDTLLFYLEDHKMLLQYTKELNTILTDGCSEELIEEKIKKRGMLLDKLIVSKKYLDSVKKNLDSSDNTVWKLQIEELSQQIRQLLDTTISLDAESVSLMKQCIKDITLNLEKIQEGKHLVNNLKKYTAGTSASLIDISG